MFLFTLFFKGVSYYIYNGQCWSEGRGFQGEKRRRTGHETRNISLFARTFKKTNIAGRVIQSEKVGKVGKDQIMKSFANQGAMYLCPSQNSSVEI